MKATGLVLSALLALAWEMAPACQAIDDGNAANAQSRNAPAFIVAEAAFAKDSALNKSSSAACGPNCGNGFACDCFRPIWFAGAEMTALHVDATPGGRIRLSIDDSDTAGLDFNISDNSGYQDFTYAPRLFIGRQIGENWSIVTRYWHLDAFDFAVPTSPVGTVNLTNFLTIDETDHVELYNFDIEAMRSSTHGCWKIDGTIGARHSSFFADSTLTTFGVFTPGNFQMMLLSNQTSFDGTGLTGSLSARRRLGNSCASLFFSGRGSNAWGTAEGRGRASGALAVSPNPPLVGAATVTRNNAEGELAISELQVGVQWERQLKCIPATAFFRTAFEYQYWRLNMPPIGGAGFGGTLGDIQINSFASAAEGKAELYGLALGAGLTW